MRTAENIVQRLLRKIGILNSIGIGQMFIESGSVDTVAAAQICIPFGILCKLFLSLLIPFLGFLRRKDIRLHFP